MDSSEKHNNTSNNSSHSSPNKSAGDLDTSEEWTILSVSPLKDEIQLTKETDFFLQRDDQSDIEEIDEAEENQFSANLPNLHSLNEDIVSNGQLDSHSGNEMDEPKSDLIESSQRLSRRRRLSHGSTSEGFSNESDIEPVRTSSPSHPYRIGEESSSRMHKEDYGDDIDDTDVMELDDEIIDLNLVGNRTRAYTHIPNSNVNLKLNLMVCFAITAGIFLGLGNYIGYNSYEYKDITPLEDKIQELQELLNSERNEVNKWKTMYREIAGRTITSSPSRSHTYDNKFESDSLHNGKFYEWLGEMDFSNIIGEGFSSGSKMVVNAMKMIVEKAYESHHIIPESMHQKINSTMSTLNSLQDKIWEKWSEVRRIEFMAENPTPEYQQVMKEMTDLLSGSLRKINEIGTKFATNFKPIPQKIEKLTSKMCKIMENLENKWRKNKERLYKVGYSEPDEETNVADLKEIDNWYISRAKSRRNNQAYPSKDGDKRSWLFKRARDREALRVKGDQGTRGRGL